MTNSRIHWQGWAVVALATALFAFSVHHWVTGAPEPSPWMGAAFAGPIVLLWWWHNVLLARVNAERMSRWDRRLVAAVRREVKAQLSASDRVLLARARELVYAASCANDVGPDRKAVRKDAIAELVAILGMPDALVTRPMAKVGALDGVRAPIVIIADDPLDPEDKIEADAANTWFRKTLGKRINAGKITYSDEPPRALKEAADEAMARIPRPFAHLEAKLNALPFVESVSIESNHTLARHDGIPGKGIRITIGPEEHGRDGCAAIAQVIHDELPFGIATSGEWCGHVGCSITGGRSVYWNWAKPAVLGCGVDYATEPERTTVSTFAVTEDGPVLMDVHELEPEDPTR